MDYKIKINNFELKKEELKIAVSGEIIDPTISKENLPRPKLVLFFDNSEENRRIPLVIKEINYIDKVCYFFGEYSYKLNFLFWSTRKNNLPFSLSLKLYYGNFEVENAVFSTPEIVSENSPFICKNEKEKIVFTYKTIKSFRCKKLLKPFGLLVTFINFLIALCLIPWFLIEALLSFLGITEIHKKVVTPIPIRRIIGHINQRVYQFSKVKITLYLINKIIIILLYNLCKLFALQTNRISFISMRRTELSGNFEFVYDKLKGRKDLDIKFLLTYSNSVWLSPLKTFKFCYLCATSKTIVLDEFTPQIHFINLRKQTKLIQLWHACGAFKTFGFTRLSKPSGSPQNTKMHRNYDFVTVSSSYCKKCHSEGFGISEEKVVPTGIPRTDVFFDDKYKTEITNKLYSQYPTLKDKKVVLFAPTFRGEVKESAFYPTEKFDISTVCKSLGDEYAIIIKHHPFVSQKQPIPDELKSRVIDVSKNTELNDLLFISDVIITDYSSLIFEASLLKTPMLFYVFDLQEYIKERDFYFDLRLNSPGKLVYSQEELISAILNKDFETERMEAFANMFFDHFDGKSSERVAKLITDSLES